MIWFLFRYSAVSLEVDCFSASFRQATPASVIWLSLRPSLVSWQVDCFSASLRLATPASVTWFPSRYSVVSWQVDCFSASLRLATPASVIWFLFRYSVVSWQVDCFRASLRLATPTSLPRLQNKRWWNRLVETNLQMHWTHSWLKTQVSSSSLATAQTFDRKKWQTRLTPERVSDELRIVRLFTQMDGCSDNAWFGWVVFSSFSELKTSIKNNKSKVSTSFMSDNTRFSWRAAPNWW